MNKQIPNYLRLVTDTSCQPPVTENEDLAPIERVGRALARATDWQLHYAPGPAPSQNTNLMWSAPVNPGVGTSPGHIRLFLPGTDDGISPRLSLEQVAPLADSIGQLWSELLATRHALWQREAELAAGVPLVIRDDDPRAPSLGQRLEAVLRGGAEAIGCQAAALYLLDQATTELKLRSSWNLPRKRLTEPARPLAPALADLEALLGHAVVLVEPTLFGYWKVPEEGFRSYACVPVSSPSMPLGTLWVFSDTVREFTDAETNILEVVAGRLASDLERETLVSQAASGRDHWNQIATAQRTQQEQLPSTMPLVDGWEVAARALHAEPVGGAFFDWFALDDGALSVIGGDVCLPGVEGAMTANLLRGAARAFDTKRSEAHRFCEKAGSILWSSSPGGAAAGLFHALVAPAAEQLEFCVAGPIRVLSIAPDSSGVLAGPSAALGLDDEARLASHHHPLVRGEIVLAYGTQFIPDADEATWAAFDQRLSLAIEARRNRPASELVDVAAEVLQSYFGAEPADRLVILMRRR